jgi:hypothetical protein
MTRVVDMGQSALPDQLMQAAVDYGNPVFTDAANEIEKSRALIKRLRRQLIDATSAKADRCKAAAEALWQLLDDIDTADDAARDDDARYRATARTIAKRRSEHAQSFDGHTLVWSWELPPELLDLAANQIKVAMHGPAPTFLERIGEQGCSSEAPKWPERYASGVLSSDDFCDIVGVCSCGAPVADYTANEALINARPAAHMEDYWVACMNVECEHHDGEGWNQGTVHEWYEELPIKGLDAFVKRKASDV